MHRAILSFWQYLRAFALLYLCLWAGNFVATILPISIPGSIIGMLILFVLLALQILPATWLQPGCHLLIRYMALLFVPVAVGVMDHFHLLQTQFGPLVVSCVVSTAVVLLIVAYGSHMVHRERKPLTSVEPETANHSNNTEDKL